MGITFTNKANEDKSAFEFSDDNIVKFINCTFDNIKTPNASPINIYASRSYTFKDCTFTDNEGGDGGCIKVDNNDANVIIDNCDFIGNNA